MSLSNLRKNMFTGRAPKPNRGGPIDYKPIKWSTFFDKKETYINNNGCFNYYLKGTIGPVIICIHGGGYSGLSWALFAREISNRVECRIIAIDLRGHGTTHTNEDENLALDQLSSDVSDLVKNIFEDENPPIIMIGHSMGGSVVVNASAEVPNVVGAIVIDIVEGTAIDSLSVMQGILRGRPRGFKSIEQAVQWGFRGGSTQNLEAARVSMPSQIINTSTKVLGSDEVELDVVPNVPPCEEPPIIATTSESCIAEEDEENETAHEDHNTMKPPLPTTVIKSPSKTENYYSWRIDLTKTEQYWMGWFKGLSQKFLDLPFPKILLLANISGMDTALTVGQMQGKFQLQVLSRSGHAVHEDQPDHVADIVATFLVRQKLATSLQGFIPMAPGC